MPVLYTPIPQNLRLGLAHNSSSLFTNNRTRDSGDGQGSKEAHEMVSHLPLQMLLYFNTYYFPFWWTSEVLMLELKYCWLPGYYQSLLVIGMVIITLTEGLRLYLGYVGNLKEKLPILLFFLTDEAIIILPLERAVHVIYLLFLLSEVLAAFLALRVMTRKLTLQFHLSQFEDTDKTLDINQLVPIPPGRSIFPWTRNIHVY
ncbi:Transmembrane protein 17A [Acipenser ruthenus]|uniref:Transmembrane protein 17A n=1 Tax=Acipenser ruthenus TaxID=7906 RepID=A0A444V733_ACIRT|nr:Transmembrane protein 17A [Acipenser ruthenus]